MKLRELYVLNKCSEAFSRPLPRVLTQHWLAHALQHGDLGRIIDPLLLLLLHPITARVSIHHLYALFDTKISSKMASAQEAERKSSNDSKVNSTKENGTAAAVKQFNKAVKRRTEYPPANGRDSDDSKTTTPSGPSEAEHSTDTDGAEADDENEENEPKKGSLIFVRRFVLFCSVLFCSVCVCLFVCLFVFAVLVR